jgi:N-acetylglucosamine kinase-like BadF-type ATPase
MADSGRTVVVGVDAGATKTDALVCDVSGHVLGFARSGRGNWEAVGLDGAARAYSEAVERALDAAGVRVGEVAASAFALAGYDWPSDGPRLGPVLDSLRIPGRRGLYNDSFAALRAGSPSPSAIISIAGTGTITAGRNALGETFRTLGIGRGEWGGAGDLVDKALDLVADDHHRGHPPSTLARMLCEEVGVREVEELFEAFSRDEWDWKRTTRLAPVVSGAAGAGDEGAMGVLTRSGRRLARTAILVARRLGLSSEPFDVVCAGGVHTGCGELGRAFQHLVRRACPRATIRLLTTPPVTGAALLALDELGPVSNATHARVLLEGGQVARESIRPPQTIPAPSDVEEPRVATSAR